MIRLLPLPALLGIACGAASLLLTQPSVPFLVAAVIGASILAAIFADAFGSETTTGRAADAAGVQDPAGGRDHATE